MRVALIVPAMNYPHLECMTVLHFPNGLACLAGALKRDGHVVIGLNPNNDFNYPSAAEMVYTKLKMMIEKEQPQLIGLGGLCTDYHFLKDSIGFIRSLAPRVQIVCGGGIITHDAEFIFNRLKPDFAVLGEGEEVLCKLVQFLETNHNNFASIPNLWYWEKGLAHFSYQDYGYHDSANRAFPDYDPFGMRNIMEEYALAQFYPIRYKRPYPKVMPIVTARSCPFSCTFCVHTRGPKYRVRPLESIMEEIKINYEKYQFNILFIVDELFAINRKRLTDFCQGIKEGQKKYGWDFDWVFNTHASADFGREELQQAKDAGCAFFSYGLESASPHVLASMNKKINPSEIAQALTYAKEIGIGFGGNFIFGDIAETSETIRESLQFFIDHCLDFFVSLIYVCAYPGSKLFEYCLERGLLPNRLLFYESGMQSKMNLVPQEDWLQWRRFIAIVYPSIDLPILKTVDAISYYPENKEVQIQPGKSKVIWKVYFTCPHCGKAIFTRELLYKSDAIQGAAAFVTSCPVCSKRFNVHIGHIGQRSAIFLPPQERKLDAKILHEYVNNIYQSTK